MTQQDKIHSILYRPHEYEIIYVAYRKDVDDFTNSFIELHLSKGNVIKKLRFYQPTEIEIEKGFNGNYSGMEILDITNRQLDGIGVKVRNFEQDPGITFMAREVLEVND